MTRSSHLVPMPRCHRWAGALCSLLLLGFIGCTSPSGGGWPLGGGSVQELHLFVMPVPITATPGGPPEGIAVRVFASAKGRATGGLIRDGKLEVLAFDGATAGVSPQTQPPTRAWSFAAAELAPFARAGSLGTGYELPLRWAGSRPVGDRLTIVLRYAPASGPILTSAPSVVQNLLK